MKLYRTSIVILFLLFIALFLDKSFVLAYNQKEKAHSNKGPIGIRNQMPLYLFYLQMIPDKAGVTETNKLKINADYTVSNISVSAFTPGTSLYDINIDLEVSRLTLDFRYGIYGSLEIGLEVPYISLSSGYLDGITESVEDGIGVKTPRSRERQGSYEFDYSFRYNNRNLIEKKHSTQGIGDMVLNAKYQLLKEGSFLPNLSLRSAVKFPTADKDDLLGSGEFDYGIGILVDKGLSDRFFLYKGANVIFIDKPGFFKELGIDKEYFSGMFAIEYLFTKKFSFVTQVSGNTTPYPFSNTNPLDNNGYELGFGFNWTCKEDKSLYFGIFENLTAASSPDVSVSTGLNWKF